MTMVRRSVLAGWADAGSPMCGASNCWASCVSPTGKLLVLLIVLLTLAAPGQNALAQQRLTVVTTTTDLKSLVEAVGGDRVLVTSMVPPAMDAEDYQPRPQDLGRLRDARMAVSYTHL